MDSQDDFAAVPPSREARAKEHFYAAVTALLESEEPPLGLPPTPAFAQQLSELGYEWATSALGPDLDAFRKHAKRSSVQPDDVVLAARKNSTTRELIEREAARLKATTAGRKPA